ncbi:MAG TPA: OmcA/MtrC family decaheme c-type cytochrome [Bryobacteraceae bacterium]|nr:OmcA/MtrC family decaheme c-type cytochrome [Bryobacteraceae bacterium]
MSPSKWKKAIPVIGLLLAVFTAAGLKSAGKNPFTTHDKAYYADPKLVSFVNPGLVITINSAKVATDGTISVVYTLTDPNGLPLDAAGATTPGVISLAYEAAYIPKGHEQYVAYTTASATGKALGTITRPNFELGGTATQLATGHYQYTFLAHTPAGFDPGATTTIGIAGNRNLTAYSLGTNYAGTTFDFVPNGSNVTVTRDVIRSQSCDSCHGQLSFHGGYAQGMNMCVLCHQPQNSDPTTGNSLDLKVMIHKIHRGSSLPSVVGTASTPGVPYQIAGYMNYISDFSKVVDPADVRRCEVCHSQTTQATQAKLYQTQPTAATCGSCHDNVNFATGTNHVGGPQPDDSQCHNCHVPQGELPFDASIKGAHIIASDTAATYPQNPNPLITGDAITITGVSNNGAGQKPVVTFTVKDTLGNPLPMSAIEDLSFTLAGPTSDYGYTSFGSDVTTPGYDTEDGTLATCDANSNCTYTFLHAIPASATGTYAIAVESERLEDILQGTATAQEVESGTKNQVVYFSVDGSPVQSRRQVVAKANCNQCHVHVTGHGARRDDPEYCIMCHNPSLTDAATRAQSKDPAVLAQAPQALNFNFLVHRIHTGANLAAKGANYVEISHNGRVDDFSNTLYAPFNGEGTPGDTQKCYMCHVNGSEQNLPENANKVTNGQYYISPTPPVSSACSGCHASKAEAAHFQSNLNSIGEACDVCHAAGAQYAVGAEHAQ